MTAKMTPAQAAALKELAVHSRFLEPVDARTLRVLHRNGLVRRRLDDRIEITHGGLAALAEYEARK